MITQPFTLGVKDWPRRKVMYRWSDFAVTPPAVGAARKQVKLPFTAGEFFHAPRESTLDLYRQRLAGSPPRIHQLAV